MREAPSGSTTCWAWAPIAGFDCWCWRRKGHDGPHRGSNRFYGTARVEWPQAMNAARLPAVGEADAVDVSNVSRGEEA